MSSMWDGFDEYGYETALDQFSTTPAPVPEESSVEPTALPKELQPVDPKTLFSATTVPKDLGQWTEDIDFPSKTIGKQSSNTAEEQKATAPEYDGPPPTNAALSQTLGLPGGWGSALDEMQNAVVGITRDLIGATTERSSVDEIFLSDNRLRGIGMILVLVAVVGIVIDMFAESEKASSMLEKIVKASGGEGLSSIL